MISCTESSKYNSKMELKNNIDYEFLVKKLNVGGFDYKIENNILRYNHADTEDIVKIVLYSQETPQNSTKQTSNWVISSDNARDIILNKYQNIMANATMFGPSVSKVENEIRGFSLTNEDVWHIRIHCKTGSVFALFFVHPTTGKVFEIQSPDNKNRCK